MRIAEQSEKNKFQALSLQDRIQRTLQACCALIGTAKFVGFSPEIRSLKARFSPTVVVDEYHSIGHYQRALVNITRTLNPGWVAWKSSKGAVQAVLIRIARSFGMQDIRELRDSCILNPVYNINPKGGSTKRIVEHLALCSLSKVPVSRVQASIPSFSFDDLRKEFAWTTNQRVPSKRIRGFDEVYAVRMSEYSDALMLLGLVPGKKLTGFHTQGWRILYTTVGGGKDTLIGYLKQVPRHVHIRVFDDIRSEKSLEQAFSKWLQDVQVKCV
jgi:hypothetical protein